MPLTVQSTIAALDDDLAPIRLVAERVADADSVIDPRTAAALLSRRPKIGVEAYACVVFAGVAPDVMTRYEEIQRSIGNRDFEIPLSYRNVLHRLNGAWIFQVSLYGLPPSMCQKPPLLDRSSRQPLDLGTANQNWRKRYSTDLNHFHFGSGPHTFQENVAYFLDGDGRVFSLLPGAQQVSEWSSIQAFLSAEIPRAESLYPGFEDRMAAVQATTSLRKSARNKRAPQR